MIDLIPNNAAHKLLRMQNNGQHLTYDEQAMLEYWLFVNQPTKQCYLLVDKLFQYCYLPEYPEVIVGTCDTFNMPMDECILHTDHNNLMYRGKLDEEYEDANGNGHYAYYFTVERFFEKRIDRLWGIDDNGTGNDDLEEFELSVEDGVSGVGNESDSEHRKDSEHCIFRKRKRSNAVFNRIPKGFV